jgi:hypothetical protein
MVLSRTGKHDEALALLDHAAAAARSAGERGLAARLAAQAAEVASDLVRMRGGYYSDAIARTRRALAEQREVGDVRGLIASAPAFVETLYIDSPGEALDIAIDAAQKAMSLDDRASAGPLAIAICDAALEAEAADVLDRWLPELASARLDASKRIEADLLLVMSRAALSPLPLRVDGELLAIADRLIALGDVTRADEPERGAVCSLSWIGMKHAARETFDNRIRAHLPPQIAALYELVLRELEGPPWSLEGLGLLDLTTLHLYDRALLHLLRGERAEADELFRVRYADRKRMSGTARQRFSPYFPGALISALGPADTEPDLDWLLGWIHRPPFPGLWIVHRAICALLLSERADPPEPGLAETAIQILDSSAADESVRQWISERARRSGS